MTDSDVKTEHWAPFHDTEHYEADALNGQVRSLPRTVKGRFYPGTDPLKCRPDGDGYMRFNYRDRNGVRHEGASRARCMLMAHDPGGWFPGAEACHGNGNRQDDRLANLRWDTSEANREEALAVRLERKPPKVKPPKVCPRCDAEHEERGKNCRACFEGIGVQFAQLLAAGVPPEKAAEQVDYPLNGALNLAVRYGGLRFVTQRHRQPFARRSLSVLFGRQASSRN